MQEDIILNAWEKQQNNKTALNNEELQAIKDTIALLDNGKITVCNKIENQWCINEWVKKAILLYLSNEKHIMYSSIVNNNSNKTSYYYDKIPQKFENWQELDFKNQQIRVVPGAFVRYGAFIGENCVIMPSFVNIGANIGDKTMIDSMTTIGSCAKIGKACHISSQVCIGGVLEPIQTKPTIIEDSCFIGAGSNITEGVLVEEGAVISGGVTISASTKIIDRETGEIMFGRIPAMSVVVPGSLHNKNIGEYSLSINCAVIVKKRDNKTIDKTSINFLLRDL